MVRATRADEFDRPEAFRSDGSRAKIPREPVETNDLEDVLLHDLRNTLAGLKLDMTLLADDLPVSGEIRTQMLAISGELQQAIQTAGRLAELLDHPGAVRQPVDSNEVLRGMVEMVQRTLPYSCRVEIELERRIWPVQVDPGLIHRALVDLVTRAEQGMPGGGLLFLTSANIDLSAARAAGISAGMSAGRCVRLAVAGSGQGAPAARPRDAESLDGAVCDMGGHVRVHHGSMMTTYELYVPAAPQAEDTIEACLDPATDPALGRPRL